MGGVRQSAGQGAVPHLPMKRPLRQLDAPAGQGDEEAPTLRADLTHERPAPDTWLPTGRVAAVAVVTVVVLSLASVPLLHLGQSVAGFHKTAAQERAWVVAPQVVGGNGIDKGQPLTFDIAVPSGHPVHWTERTDGVQIDSGFVTGSSGSTVQVTVSSSAATVRHWLSIWIEGISTPLKVWVMS
jgi:hypothetical protein